MTSSSSEVVQREAAQELARWDRNIDIAEDVVFSRFLVDAAKGVGIDADKVVRFPYDTVEKVDKGEQVKPTMP